MIVQERFSDNGRDFIRTFSNDGRYIVGGEPYGEYIEVCDPAEYERTYIEGELMEYEPSAEEILNILMGGDGE